MIKINVDYDRCDSNGVCVQMCPEVFEIREDGFLYLFMETAPADLAQKLSDAEDGCPTGAISLEEVGEAAIPT